VWYIQETTVNAAAAKMVDLWADFLRTCCSPLVYAYEVYASDLLPTTVEFTTLPITPGSQRGTIGGLGGDVTNLYNPQICSRFDLTVPGGFSSRKWMRCGLIEGAIAPGGLSISSTFWSDLQAAALADVIADAAVRDESGNAFSGIVDKGLQAKRLGKFARYALPTPPAFG
jgi:hypothetical protein